MELIIDIGNSNVVIGLWKEDRWKMTWRLQTIKDGEALLFYKQKLDYLFLENDIRIQQFSRVVLSSVVPELNETAQRLIEGYGFKRIDWVNQDKIKSLDIQIDNPKEIGSDLVANAVAAYHKYQKSCIIIDFGTALTFTTINDQGGILGVTIAPGLKTAILSLFGGTAQLPVVSLELPKSVIGKNTTHAIQSGVLWGYVGLIKNIILQISEEINTNPKVIATGGLSSILHPLNELIDSHDPNLTLDGIRLI